MVGIAVFWLGAEGDCWGWLGEHLHAQPYPATPNYSQLVVYLPEVPDHGIYVGGINFA